MKIKKIYPILFLALFCLIPYLINAGGAASSSPAVKQFEVKLYRTKSKKIETVPLKEYLCGVVAAEMSADYESEALKAQAVAACSYLMYRRNYIQSDSTYDNGHAGAYVCDDPTHCKGYLAEADAKKRWGRDWFGKYYSNITAAVDQVYGQVVTYDGEIANTVFHAISSGRTESAENVWGADIPYLQSVESTDDTVASGYESNVAFTHDEAAKILQGLQITVKGAAQKWFSAPTIDSAGSVASVEVCGKKVNGGALREAFGLRSTAFAVTVTDKEIIFTVHGYGHQVGMSQNGANELAKKGKSYTEILEHYYKGAKVQSYNFEM